MKVFALLFVNLVFVESISLFNTISVQPIPLNFDVMIEVVGNYLDKYISHKISVLSIATASSSVQQKYFQKDLIEQLLITNLKICNFSYKILNKVDQTRPANNRAFNLIFIDGTNSLGLVD